MILNDPAVYIMKLTFFETMLAFAGNIDIYYIESNKQVQKAETMAV